MQGALCLREKRFSDCIFDSRMLQSNICESSWLLECGAVKQWEMTSLLGAHSLAANRALQNRKKGWNTTNEKICTVLVCKNNCKLLFNSFGHFHLISYVSRPQRPLIYDCIHFPPPPPSFPCRQHFQEKCFRCPFHSKSAPRNCPSPPPPPTNFLMLPTPCTFP